MIRKTGIPIRSLPSASDWILKNATGEQLDYLNSLSNSGNFKVLVKIVENFKHYNVYEVFKANVKDADELMAYRAAKRGEVAGLDALLYAIQGASLEISRRKNESA